MRRSPVGASAIWPVGYATFQVLSVTERGIRLAVTAGDVSVMTWQIKCYLSVEIV